MHHFTVFFISSLRSKSLALHAVRSRSINSDTGEDGDGLESSPDNMFSNTMVNSHSENQEAPSAERKLTGDGGVKEAEKGQSREKQEQEDADRLFVHLRDNMETIREFCRDMVQQIPTPEQCVIEGNVNMTNSFFFEVSTRDNAMTVLLVYAVGVQQREGLCNLNEITVSVVAGVD